MLTSGNKNKALVPYDYSSSCAFYMFAVLVILLCQGVAGVVAAAIERAYPGVSGSGVFNTACMIFFQAANAALIYFYTRINRQKFNFAYVDKQHGGVTPMMVVLPVILAVVLMCTMYLPTVWYGLFTRVIGIPESAGALVIDNAASVVMVVVASVFLAPVCEETIYRGVLLHGLKKEFSPVKAVMMSSVAFMMMHMSPLQVIFQFALGVLSGFVALKTKRLLPSIVLHAASNALALIIQLTPLSTALAGCVVWLTRHVAAAVFITLALFVAGGGLCFVAVKFGFGKGAKAAHDGLNGIEGAERDAAENSQTADGEAETGDGNRAPEIMRKQVLAQMKKRDGLVKYFIGIGICAVMFIINLVSMILS